MKFFTNNLKISSLLPLIDNNHDFEFIRSHLVNRPTATEHAIASRIANTIDTPDHDAINDPLVREHLKKKSKWVTNLIVHYTHEARFETYQTECLGSVFREESENDIRKIEKQTNQE